MKTDIALLAVAAIVTFVNALAFGGAIATDHPVAAVLYGILIAVGCAAQWVAISHIERRRAQNSPRP